MRLLIISNGHGEDHIACNLIRACRDQWAKPKIKAIPLVGKGLAYKKINIQTLSQNKTFPSGGFIRRWKDLLHDLFAGIIRQSLQHYRLIKEAGKNVDLIICVGDVYALFLSHFAKNKPLYFLPTAKSDRFMKHYWIEYKCIQKWAQLSFPRDQLTTDSFLKNHCPAHFFGNPMMDFLIPPKPLLSNRPPFLVGLLPGSREEAYQNLEQLIPIMQALTKATSPQTLMFLLAKSPSLSWNSLKNTVGWVEKKQEPHCYLSDPYSEATLIITESFLNVVFDSDILIGLSGTANEQAVHCKKHVFCFEGAGPQTTRKRFEEQRKLLGNRLHVIHPATTQTICNRILSHLSTTGKATETEQTSQPNASEKIVSCIQKRLGDGAREGT